MGVHPGEVIAGKFRIERVLGKGGMGYVVAARHLQLGQMVALKFMHDEVCTPEYRSRFLREARNTVRLKSKHVSRVLDVGTLDGGAPYMVMEYLEGTDLSELLHRGGQPLPVPDVCDYVIQACEAIAEAHSHGIVHRDLKPANLFLTRGPHGEPVVKVLDFGVSKVLDLETDGTRPGGRPRAHPDSAVTKATDLLGSPSYMAPEQIASARDADAQSDIWSLGVILFRLISGKAPFNAQALGELIQQITHLPVPNLRDFKADLPPALEHVVALCLERDRARRFHDVGELARALAPYATPLVTPSLERIAILGPALVTAPSSHPNPVSTSPSWSTAGSSAWTGPTGPPPPAPAPAPSRDLGKWSAVAIGLLATFAIVAVTVAFLGYRSGKLGAPAPSSASAAPAAPETSPAVTSPEDVPPTDVASPPAPAPPPTSEASSASPGAKGGASQPRPVAPRPRPRPRASASAPADIPATRE